MSLGEGKDRNILHREGDHDDPHEEEPHRLYTLPHSEWEACQKLLLRATSDIVVELAVFVLLSSDERWLRHTLILA